jgi:hypothetical protein
MRRDAGDVLISFQTYGQEFNIDFIGTQDIL